MVRMAPFSPRVAPLRTSKGVTIRHWLRPLRVAEQDGNVAGVELEYVPTDTNAEPAELIASNPLGKIPVLIADDGERIRLSREGLFVSDAIWPEML
jgi:glutathione S-transferase